MADDEIEKILTMAGVCIQLVLDVILGVVLIGLAVLDFAFAPAINRCIKMLGDLIARYSDR